MIKGWKLRVLNLFYPLLVGAIILGLTVMTAFRGEWKVPWPAMAAVFAAVLGWAWLWRRWVRCPHCGDRSFELQHALMGEHKTSFVCPRCAARILVR